MEGIRVNRKIGLRVTAVNRTFVAIRFSSRREHPRRASQTPVNRNRGSGRGSSGGGGGGRTLSDMRSGVAAIGWGALDQLENELSEDGAIPGVIGRFVGCIVADLALSLFSLQPLRQRETWRPNKHDAMAS